ncbi:MAG TPA: serine/threonine-protein kinase [Ktedonobacteraceae bacterium]|nr:serine/threonine-protein kinase [Ktedonobacteraceae bacterium]
MSTTRGQHLIGKEIGECVLEQLLGYGGSSAVFLAQPRNSTQKVAVKVFLPRSTMDTQTQKSFYRRFLREARAASELSHPNILSIYSYGEDHGLPYIVMPYMSGGTLAEYVKRHGPLPLDVACHYLQQIAAALDYAHEHNCVHCDVKPANLLLDNEGHIYLTDFGIVRMMQTDHSHSSPKSSEALMGTPDYISPEQALGERLDGRSDIYSLGVTLFYLLAGKPPFQAESSIAIALQHVHDTPPALGLIRADITPEIDIVLGKALAKWPDDRYQTAGAFSKAFSKAVTEAPARSDSGKHGFRKLLQKGQSGDREALKPVVQVKPLPAGAAPRFRLTRSLLLVGLLVLVLFGSITTAIAVNIAARSHTSPPVTGITPTPIIDHLTGDQDAWPTSSTLFFKDGRYYINNTSRQAPALALYSSYEYSDMRLTVTASEVRGSRDGADYYGVVLHAAIDQSHFYLFELSAWSGGVFEFLRYDGQWHALANGSVSSLHSAIGQSNIITITIQKNIFSFQVNGVSVGQPYIDRTTHAFSSGEIGLYVEETDTEVAFSDLQIKPV